jgi:hypothetical protein
MTRMGGAPQMRNASSISVGLSASALPRSTPGAEVKVELASCTSHFFDLASIVDGVKCDVGRRSVHLHRDASRPHARRTEQTEVSMRFDGT